MRLPRLLLCLLASSLLLQPVFGCATPSGAPPHGSGQGTDPADPNSPPPVGGNAPGRPSVGTRAQSALEGALMGSIIGGQAGPIGAAVGAGTLMLYSALTGQVPFQGSRGPGGDPGGSERDREEAIEDQIDDEVVRQASIESEIQ